MYSIFRGGIARVFLALFACGALLSLLAGSAQAKERENPGSRTETVAAGSYIIDVTFSQDPPYVDQPFDVMVIPHDTVVQLSGKVTAQPGLGTEAVDLSKPLEPTGQKNILKSTLHIPVRGAWNIKVYLDGPQGAGEATIPTTAGAPGAMPSWIAWLIGSFPLVFIAFWILHQHFYRRNALVRQHA